MHACFGGEVLAGNRGETFFFFKPLKFTAVFTSHLKESVDGSVSGRFIALFTVPPSLPLVEIKRLRLRFLHFVFRYGCPSDGLDTVVRGLCWQHWEGDKSSVVPRIEPGFNYKDLIPPPLRYISPALN